MKINITDITLREEVRHEATTLGFKEKIEIAKLLDKLEVDVIETAEITDEKTDTLMLKTIATLLNKSILATPTGLSKESIKKTWDAISPAKESRIIIEVPVSIVSMEYLFHKKPSKILEDLENAIKYAISLTKNIEITLLDATRAEEEFLVQVIKHAVELGVGIITIKDSEGLMLPQEFHNLIKGLYEKIPDLKNIQINIECSDKLSLANSCIISAIETGVVGIKVSSVKRDIPTIDTISMLIKLKGDKLGIESDINTLSQNRIIKQITDITNEKRSLLHVFHAQEETERKSLLLDDTTDIETISKTIKTLGYELSNEDITKVYEAFIRVAQKKDVGVKEIEAIIGSTALQVPPTYKLISYVINSGNIIDTTANIVLEKNDRQLKGLSIAGGPIDAAFLAIEQIIGHHYELDDFQIQAVTESRTALGDTLVKLRHNGKLFSGRGVSQDIIEASIRAYINAINKIVYEE